MSRSGIALGNLRAVVIVIVLAFHAVLPYLAFLPAPAHRFDSPPYRWQAFPIIDRERWFGFDLFCSWQDVSLMALMFFLSGLFVWPSLQRKGNWTFLSDRLMRIAVPCALAIAFLMPLAYYPAYRVTAVDPGVTAYWQQWKALPFWPCGPQWFLCQLVALNVLVAALHRFAPGSLQRLIRSVSPLLESPVRFFAGLVAVSAIAYVPLAIVYSPFTWTNLGPISFQDCRPLLYAVYFFAGVAVGARGLDRGLLACDGLLARRWAAWLAAALAGWALWAGLTSITMDDWHNGPLLPRIAASLGYVIACAAGSLVLLALCLRFAQARTRAFDSLSANAYGMYLVHYVFAVWLQYALLDLRLFAIGKAAIVLVGTLLLSWVVTAALGGVSLGTQPVEPKRGVRGA
jgi:hypothetical protein